MTTGEQNAEYKAVMFVVSVIRGGGTRIFLAERQGVFEELYALF